MQAQNSSVVGRPQTSKVGQRQLSEVFNADVIAKFKSQADILHKNLHATIELTQLVSEQKKAADSTDETTASFFAQYVCA